MPSGLAPTPVAARHRRLPALLLAIALVASACAGGGSAAPGADGAAGADGAGAKAGDDAADGTAGDGNGAGGDAGPSGAEAPPYRGFDSCDEALAALIDITADNLDGQLFTNALVSTDREQGPEFWPNGAQPGRAWLGQIESRNATDGELLYQVIDERLESFGPDGRAGSIEIEQAFPWRVEIVGDRAIVLSTVRGGDEHEGGPVSDVYLSWSRTRVSEIDLATMTEVASFEIDGIFQGLQAIDGRVRMAFDAVPLLFAFDALSARGNPQGFGGLVERSKISHWLPAIEGDGVGVAGLDNRCEQLRVPESFEGGTMFTMLDLGPGLKGSVRHVLGDVGGWNTDGVDTVMMTGSARGAVLRRFDADFVVTASTMISGRAGPFPVIVHGDEVAVTVVGPDRSATAVLYDRERLTKVDSVGLGRDVHAVLADDAVVVGTGFRGGDITVFERSGDGERTLDVVSPNYQFAAAGAGRIAVFGIDEDGPVLTVLATSGDAEPRTIRLGLDPNALDWRSMFFVDDRWIVVPNAAARLDGDADADVPADGNAPVGTVEVPANDGFAEDAAEAVDGFAAAGAAAMVVIDLADPEGEPILVTHEQPGVEDNGCTPIDNQVAQDGLAPGVDLEDLLGRGAFIQACEAGAIGGGGGGFTCQRVGQDQIDQFSADPDAVDDQLAEAGDAFIEWCTPGGDEPQHARVIDGVLWSVSFAGILRTDLADPADQTWFGQ